MGHTGMAKRLFICQKINVFSLLALFPALTCSPSSISPSSLIWYSSVQAHYSCSRSSSPLSGQLTRNDRAFCRGVWNTRNITCQLKERQWLARSGRYAGKARHFTSTLLPSLFKSHYGQTVFFSWLEVNDSLTLCSKCFSARSQGS